MQLTYSLVALVSSALCLKEVVIDTPKTFESTAKKTVVETGGCDTYLFYMGNINATSGISWCPDTAKALPLVTKYLNKIQDSTIIKVMVGNRTEWKSPYNHYKYHPWANLTAIPTLVRFYEEGPEFESLVEGDCYDETKLKKYLGVD
ncbi:hypothetical protein CONCODRAFT_17242 [Conidiobolus coronatus NRRL 28638]|uniref:Thioredoxin domain-containing protein n=1 Tax=Conidiobolus coronatus (strain ATCC 28846 / CBS 209.66 / NRRL 28638) TaxID=796925 RepID=A0A137P7I8_CONC2|nr:hypothetical protein CONCODRAFT_17242 [Conidiobolus coronatus NRRL 28638]|eukprot:KXN70976.1 hypothetical protein CONCODRAFT_17242 [Conidiobolus coronatus NRRL 28638]